MSNVIDLKPKPVRVTRPDDVYVCTRCNSELFRLTPLGMVHCGNCGLLMRSLLVTPTGSVR